MATALPEDVKKLIDGPNFAHLATIMPDGSPQSAPVWVLREGDRILVGTGEVAVKDVTARKYTGKEFPWRNPEGQVALVVEVDRARFAKLPFTHAPAGAAR